MVNSKIKYTFCSFIFILLSLPSLSYLGIKDIETIEGNMDSKEFFLRNIAVKVTNQIYEWMNLGQMHSGYSYNIKTFDNGALVEEGYVTLYMRNEGYNEEINKEALLRIKRIKTKLEKQGIKSLLILAPDKLSLYKEKMPWYLYKLWRINVNPPMPKCKKVVDKYGIPCFDAYSYLEPQLKKGPMFSYAGTHWNALAASLIMEKILSDNGYRTNKCKGLQELEKKEYAEYADDDLGNLLNLCTNPIRRKNKSYRPLFNDREFKNNEGSIIIFGDSFTGQIATYLMQSNTFEPSKILMCDKRVPTQEEYDNIKEDLKMVIFVYQPPFFFSLQNTLGAKLEGLETLLNND